MAETVIILSDVHMGRGDELDNFRRINEKAFLSFLATKSGELTGKVDLVLLGDTFDVWQVAPDNEKKARHTKEIDINVNVGSEASRMNEILASHSEALDGLGQFVQADRGNRTLHIVIGNHDHALIDSGIQRAVRDAIAAKNPAPHDRIVFSHYYDRPDMGLYAEHGNQYEESNKYHSVDVFTPECPGYYFVRLFFNRMEAIEPMIGCWGSWFQIFEIIWEHHLIRHLPTALRFFNQYRKDRRVPELIEVMGVPVPKTRGPAPTPASNRLPAFPDLLFTGKSDQDRIFSRDPETENRLRDLYHRDGEFRAFVDETLGKKATRSVPAIPKEPVPAERRVFPDPYAAAANRMFGTSPGHVKTMPLKGIPLDPGTYKRVVFGHTHESTEKELSHCTYLNTGSWCYREDADDHNISKLHYLIFSKGAGGGVNYHRDCWPNG